MAAIGEAEDTFVEFEGDIDMHTVFRLVGALQKFFGVSKPEELAVELEMNCEQAAVQNEKHIFALAFDGADAAALHIAGDVRGGLRLRGDGVKDVNATDSPTLDQGTERANDSFDFRKFRHRRWARSRARFEGERVLARLFLSGIAERRENGFAFVPVGKLIGIVAATGLA